MKKYFLFFILSLTIYVTHAIYTKHAIYGDGNGYYATAQSLLYEGKLNSEGILDHLKNFPGRDYVFSRVFWNEKINPYPLGTSLTWMPGLAITSFVSGNRYDLFHELSTGITGIILMLSGLYFLEKYLLNFFSPSSVTITILSLFLGSNVFYYTTFEPALSHQPAFFIVSFLLYWTHKFKYSKINLFVLGILFGFLPVTRLADVVVLIPIFFLLKLDLQKIFIFGLGVAFGLLPQLYAQYFYYGTIMRNFYVTEMHSAWSLDVGHVYEYLFSYKRGLFIWSPIYLLGVYGLIKMKKKAIIFTITLLWLIGAFWSAYSSAGFGQRLSFSAIPYFGIGIAYVYDKLKIKNQYLFMLAFVLWNIFLLYGFYILDWKSLP